MAKNPVPRNAEDPPSLDEELEGVRSAFSSLSISSPVKTKPPIDLEAEFNLVREQLSKLEGTRIVTAIRRKGNLIHHL